MKNKLFLISSLVAVLILGSCENYLDETPDKSGSAYIYHMDQLYGLTGSLDLYFNSQPTLFLGRLPTWSKYMTEQAILSDAVEITPSYYLRGTSGVISSLYNIYSFGNDDLIKQSGITSVTWTPCWKNIYTFNTVLENLDKVLQTTEAIRNQVEGEARFGRAYYHFILLTQYCLWKEDAPGIGYREGIDAAGIPARETVKYTLDKIYEDLRLAEEALIKAGRVAFDLARNFRPTVPTVQAFRARVDLYRGNYDAALSNADKALAAHNTLVAFKDEPDYQLEKTKEIALLKEDGSVEKTLDIKTMKKLINRNALPVAEFEELFLPSISNTTFYGTLPMSESFYNVWTDKENDARWLHFYAAACGALDNYSTSGNIVNPKPDEQGRYPVSWEARQWLKEANFYSYVRFTGNAVFLGMTTAEMYLIKAECLARKNQTAQAAEVLKTLRRTRFLTTASAENIGGSVQEVLDERYRELGAFWRYFDIKRLNGAENAGIHIRREIMTDPTNLNSTVILDIAPDDPRWAIPFNEQEVERTGWKQNPGWE